MGLSYPQREEDRKEAQGVLGRAEVLTPRAPHSAVEMSTARGAGVMSRWGDERQHCSEAPIRAGGTRSCDSEELGEIRGKGTRGSTQDSQRQKVMEAYHKGGWAAKILKLYFRALAVLGPGFPEQAGLGGAG